MGVYNRDNLPIGSIIAIASSQGWSTPSAGQIKNSYALCDGQPYSSLPSGKYHPSFSGNKPNISDNRFLSGGTTPGTASPSQNLIKLTSSNIPSTGATSNQSANHSHAFGGGNGSWWTGGVSVNHTHYFSGGTDWGDTGHTHYYETGIVSHDHIHNYIDYRYQDDGADQDLTGEGDETGRNLDRWVTTYGSGNHTHTAWTGGVNANHTHNYSGWTEWISASHTHSSSGNTGNDGAHNHTFGASTPSDIDNRPLYFSVVYVIKVK